MSISLVGAGSAEATTIAIPGTEAPGDLIIIFAFRGATTAPTLPAGWTSLGTASSGASSYTLGWKLCITAGDASGTWTNATGLVCHVYRNTATNKTPVLIGTATTATSATITYGAVSEKAPGTSWIVGMGATKTNASTIETPPTNLTNQADTVGAATEYAGHDSNGTYTAGAGAWPSTDVSAGTSAEYRTVTMEVLAEGGLPNNFQSLKDAAGGDTGILSFTERTK